jgi:hypothetical protein
VYYGIGGIAVLVMLLSIYLIYASAAVFTSHNTVVKAVAYITVLLDAGFIGFIFDVLPSGGSQCSDKRNSSHQ